MWIYQLLIRLLLPIAAVFLVFTKHKTPYFLSQRLGFNYRTVFKNQQPIWIHCASVGEVKAVEQLVQHFSKQHAILITTNTPTSKILVDNLFDSNNIQHQYCPYDLPMFINNFIKVHNPSLLWVVETEIWANMFNGCYQKNIPVKIINARLSKKSLNVPNWLKDTYTKTLQKTTQILTRSEQEKKRFIAFGVEPSKIKSLGNLKYSAIANDKVATANINRDFVLLASSHEDEELTIAQIWLQLNRPELLIIVPRHPKRGKKITQQLEQLTNINLVVYSQNKTPNQHTNIYLFDTIGKLSPLFAEAKLVIMGGSFVKKGGHNILEPASVKSAIITGEDMSDFEDETELLKEFKGIQQVNSYEQLEQLLASLLDDKKALQQQGENAYQATLSQQNILNEYFEQLTI